MPKRKREEALRQAEEELKWLKAEKRRLQKEYYHLPVETYDLFERKRPAPGQPSRNDDDELLEELCDAHDAYYDVKEDVELLRWTLGIKK